MNWTDERVELLKKLWAEGFSASQIAAQLGGVTRNAVIGKAHRLKLSGRTKAQPRLRKAGLAAPEDSAADKTGPSADIAAERGAQSSIGGSLGGSIAAGMGGGAGGKSRRRPSGGISVIGATALKLEFVEDIEEDMRPRENVVINMTRRLTLMQLTEHTCKWPVGDPLSEDFYFCGADSGESGPYCACHAKLAFNSDKRRH